MLPLMLAVLLYASLIYVCGRFTAGYAAQRGRSKALWFAVGGLFYPLPYIVLALLPPRAKANAG